jgi:hypothetical protein
LFVCLLLPFGVSPNSERELDRYSSLTKLLDHAEEVFTCSHSQDNSRARMRAHTRINTILMYHPITIIVCSLRQGCKSLQKIISTIQITDVRITVTARPKALTVYAR